MRLGPRVFAPEAGQLVNVAEVKAQMDQAANTVPVKDIRSGSGNSYIRTLTPAVGQLFFLANDGTSTAGDSQTWEFHYRLKPRSAEVVEIPVIRLDYYKPGSEKPDLKIRLKKDE